MRRVSSAQKVNTAAIYCKIAAEHITTNTADGSHDAHDSQNCIIGLGVECYCLEAYTIENRKGCGVLLFGSLYKGGKIDTDVKYHLCGGYVKYHLFRKSTLGRIIDTDVE